MYKWYQIAQRITYKKMLLPAEFQMNHETLHDRTLQYLYRKSNENCLEIESLPIQSHYILRQQILKNISHEYFL